jgi:hypothetical protein
LADSFTVEVAIFKRYRTVLRTVTGTNEPLPLRCNLLLCSQITIETYLDFFVLEKKELTHSAILYGLVLSLKLKIRLY